MPVNFTRFALCMIAALALFSPSFAQANDKPVKVFILAGQSNMSGHGKVEMGLNPDYNPDDPKSKREVPNGIGCLRYMVNQNPETFGPKGKTPLVDSEGKWLPRNDVAIYGHVNGKLETGWLAPGIGGKGNWFGPEYGFGHAVGDAMDDDILIIKVARGGTALGDKWRPPSIVAEHGGEVGEMWTLMVEQMEEAISNLDKHLPQYKGRKIEVIGFGWHQGWNDRVSKQFKTEYERNLVGLIKDVRRLAQNPKLPIVIATTSMAPGKERSEVELAQMAVGDAKKYPQFKGNVITIDTKPFWRDKTQSPSGFGYHWNHNGVTHYELGIAMGQAMLGLLGEN